MRQTSHGLEWTDAFAIIGTRHKRLLRTIGDLLEPLYAGQGSKRLKQLFDELLEYVQVHFAGQELVMANSGYRVREAHRADHVRFKQTILKLASDRGKATTGLCVNVFDFLQHRFTLDFCPCKYRFRNC